MPIPFDIDSLMHDVMNGWQGCADEDEVHYVGDDYDLFDVVALLSAFAPSSDGLLAPTKRAVLVLV